MLHFKSRPAPGRLRALKHHVRRGAAETYPGLEMGVKNRWTHDVGFQAR